MRNSWLALLLYVFVGHAHADIDAMVQILQVPTSVAAGQRFSATFRLTNTGTVTLLSRGTNPIVLGSWAPQDNTTWGKLRVSLDADLAPGQSVDITETFTAPATAGVQPFSWRCVQENVRWFCAEATAQIDVNAGVAGGSPALPPSTAQPPRAAAGATGGTPSLPPASVLLPRVPGASNTPSLPPPSVLLPRIAGAPQSTSQSAPSGVTLSPMPLARPDGSLVSAGIIELAPYAADGVLREVAWTNRSGRELEIHQVYLWSGVDLGTRADVHADLRRGSDDSYLAILQWDRYAEPTAPNNHAVFRYNPPYMRIAQGEVIKLRYRAEAFNGKQYRAAHYVIIWAR